MKRKILSVILAVVMIVSAIGSLGISAFALEFSGGETVSVAKYDATTDAYTMGTIKTVKRSLGGHQYIVLDETSYQENGNTISDKAKSDLKLIESTVNEVFNTRKEFVDLSKYGSVDSRSAPYATTVAIAPYAVPILEKNGLADADCIWLAVGDRAGTTARVYLSYIPKEESTPSAGDDKGDVSNPDSGSTSGSGNASGSQQGTVAIPDGEKISVNILVPKKMSIRFQDGSVYQSGASIELPLDKEVKFQMCSNNWDNNTYDDNGNGLAGTVVYTAIVSSSAKKNSFDAATKTYTIAKSDKALRTDTNNFFMAYRFYFANGNYNKQTGITNVVNTPLESLSVNLPLGSTISCDAYKGMGKIDSANVFIETAEDKTICYKDYNWQY